MAVVTTTPGAEEAERIATRLVEERLIACANILPGATSIYRWEGRVQRASEVMIVFKTTAETLPRLRERLADLHPYDLPEVLAFAVPDGSDDYLSWVRDAVRSDP